MRKLVERFCFLWLVSLGGGFGVFPCFLVSPPTLVLANRLFRPKMSEIVLWEGAGNAQPPLGAWPECWLTA